MKRAELLAALERQMAAAPVQPEDALEIRLRLRLTATEVLQEIYDRDAIREAIAEGRRRRALAVPTKEGKPC